MKKNKMITIYHNPRCSKSREALAFTEKFARENDMELNVIEYLKTSPTPAQLRELHQQVGGDLSQLLRTNEDEYKQLDLAQAEEAEILNAIHAHPILLQRPIIVYHGKALVARPPDLLHDFLQP